MNPCAIIKFKRLHMTKEEFEQIDAKLKEIEEKPDDELTLEDIQRHTELVNRVIYSYEEKK